MHVDTHHQAIEQAGRRYVEQIKRMFAVDRCFLYDLSQMGCDDDAGESAVLFVLLNGNHSNAMDDTLAISKIGATILKETGVRIVANPVWQDEWENRPDLNSRSLPLALGVEPITL